eukprot:scaffold237_cov421-Prasinococcus_capsulatus_cf.AAC.26
MPFDCGTDSEPFSRVSSWGWAARSGCPQSRGQSPRWRKRFGPPAKRMSPLGQTFRRSAEGWRGPIACDILALPPPSMLRPLARGRIYAAAGIYGRRCLLSTAGSSVGGVSSLEP